MDKVWHHVCWRCAIHNGRLIFSRQNSVDVSLKSVTRSSDSTLNFSCQSGQVYQQKKREVFIHDGFHPPAEWICFTLFSRCPADRSVPQHHHSSSSSKVPAQSQNPLASQKRPLCHAVAGKLASWPTVQRRAPVLMLSCPATQLWKLPPAPSLCLCLPASLSLPSLLSRSIPRPTLETLASSQVCLRWNWNRRNHDVETLLRLGTEQETHVSLTMWKMCRYFLLHTSFCDPVHICFTKEVLFCLNFSSSVAQQCWFTLYQWRAKKGWVMTYLTL